MSRFHNINGEDIPFTAEEEALRDAEEAAEAAKEPERAWTKIRAERNARLAATDWRVLPDQPDSQAWREYRQALRDLTKASKTDDVVWPNEPA